MKSLIMLLVSLLGFQQLAYTQNKKGEEKGTHVCKLQCNVYDAETKKALPQANVFITNLNKGTTTDLDGKSELHLHKGCACTCDLKISFIGYKDHIAKLEVINDTTISIFLEEDSELLESVVIEDTRLNTTISSLTVSKVSARALESSRAEAIGYSLEKISGVSTLKSGSGNIAKPVIHGLYGNRITILYNGVRMEGQQWGLEHAPELDPFIADNLSVIKGAASVRYGANAMGGVVVVNPAGLPTRKGISGKANLVGMSNGRTAAGALQLEGGLELFGTEGWGWRIQGSTKRGGDLRAPDYHLTNTGVREMNYSGSFGWHNHKWGWDVFYSHFGTELGILNTTVIGNLDDLERALTTAPQDNPFSYDIANPRQEAMHNLLKLRAHHRSGLGKWSLQYALQSNKRREFDVRRGTLNDIPSMNLEITTHTLDLDLEHKFGDHFTGNVGASGMYQDNRNIFGTQRSNFIPNYQSFSGGIYLVERWQKNKVQFELGARYDIQAFDIAGWNSFGFYYDDFKTQNLSATIGAVYQLSKSSSFSTNIGTSWRPPHVAELYSYGKHQSNGRFEYGLLWTWEQDGTNFDFFIDEYDPQKIKNEQGVKWVGTYNYETDKTFAEVSVYANYIQNFIYSRPQGITNSTAGTYPYAWYRQTDVLFTGMDAVFTHQLNSKLTWSGRGSIVRAQDQSNKANNLINIPASRFSNGLQYEVEKWKGFHDVFVKVELAYTAQKQNAPRVLSFEAMRQAYISDVNLFAEDDTDFDYLAAPDAYLLGNLELGFSKAMKKSELSCLLKVQNIANTRYRDYTNSLRYFTDDMGRNISLSLLYKFNQD